MPEYPFAVMEHPSAAPRRRIWSGRRKRCSNGASVCSFAPDRVIRHGQAHFHGNDHDHSQAHGHVHSDAHRENRLPPGGGGIPRPDGSRGVPDRAAPRRRRHRMAPLGRAGAGRRAPQRRDRVLDALGAEHPGPEGSLPGVRGGPPGDGGFGTPADHRACRGPGAHQRHDHRVGHRRAARPLGARPHRRLLLRVDGRGARRGPPRNAGRDVHDGRGVRPRARLRGAGAAAKAGTRDERGRVPGDPPVQHDHPALRGPRERGRAGPRMQIRNAAKVRIRSHTSAVTSILLEALPAIRAPLGAIWGVGTPSCPPARRERSCCADSIPQRRSTSSKGPATGSPTRGRRHSTGAFSSSWSASAAAR